MGDLKLSKAQLAFNYFVLTLLAAFSLGPIVVMFFNSVKPRREIASNPWGFPRTIMWDNFSEAWTQGKFAEALLNSSIISLGTIFGILIISGLAAYALTKLDVPGKSLWTFYFLVGIGVPPLLYLIPLFYLWHQVGLTDNIFGVMIIYWAFWSPFSIFLLRSYFIGIHQDFLDAARVDGASEIEVLLKIMFPLVKPGFLTVGLIVGMWSWNEFLFALTFLHSPENHSVVIRFLGFSGRFQINWSLTSAAAVIMAAPILIMFIIMQKRFIEGMVQGGIKG